MSTQIECPVCRLWQFLPGATGRTARLYCARCGQLLSSGPGHSRAWAFCVTLAALILYVPANLLPMLRFNYMGAYSENTVIDGALALYRHDMWPIALLVFLTSVLVPLLKLLSLFYLTLPPPGWDARRRTALYRFIRHVGPWAMLDVFLVAILVALLKLGDLATVLPGTGLWAFACVVVLTQVASQGFDPCSLWISDRERHEPSGTH